MIKDHFLFYSRQIDKNKVLLDKYEKHHAVSVLRAAPGDEICVTDGSGSIYGCTVDSVAKDKMSCLIKQQDKTVRTSPCITAAVGLPERAAFEEILQSLTALGVRTIVPLITDHCRKPWWEKWQKCINRFDDKMVVAMKQCLYPYLPDLKSPVLFRDFIAGAAASKLLVADQYGVSIKDSLLKTSESIHCLIGPPGGFAEQENEVLQNRGIVKVKLASNRLRTELAAVVFCSQVIGFLQ